mmetsp:Transcript_95731/g.270941  ORF Transcript_95731/g.270941 Transcript_95731/m.270941 type:complete len:274 (+) Transcript_95731:63-884(+)
MGCGASAGSGAKYKDDTCIASQDAGKKHPDATPASSSTAQAGGDLPPPGGVRSRPQAWDVVQSQVNGAQSASQLPGRPACKGGHAATGSSVATGPVLEVTTPTSPSEEAADDDAWYARQACIQQRANELLDAYNYFFEHIGIRKGWRTAPFERSEVQMPFRAASEVVAQIRAKLDEDSGRGMVLRQLEGSAMNYLWSWPQGRSPSASQDVFEEFLRGLVFATLSDGRGLVEGLDEATVEQYVRCHPSVAIGGSADPSAEPDAMAIAEPPVVVG